MEGQTTKDLDDESSRYTVNGGNDCPDGVWTSFKLFIDVRWHDVSRPGTRV